jgi:putative membrane protein
MFYPMYGHAWSPLHTLGPLFWILFSIVVLVVLAKAGRRNYRGEGHGSAMSILRERFAKGEISKEEFEERKKALEAK